MKNYSQNDEQAVILNYFKGFKGTFCDIGSNDGITFSNTYALVLSGWTGLLIEPSWNAFQRMKQNLKKELSQQQVIMLNCAVGAKNGRMVLNESGALIGQDDVSLVSTFHASEMDRFKKVVQYSPVEVDVMDWRGCISPDITPMTFDFISMDIEGSELEVLPQMDLSEVKLFCIEWNGKPELKAAYEPYFEGFKLIHTTGENLIYGR
jgi:FkbM family methyltransferase